jgi:RNA polymerase sigma factor (sigma-70 family)
VVSVADLPNTAETGQSEARLEESLDAALLELDPEDRRLIERFYLDGRSQKEVAGELNLTPKAVSSRLERARARLRALVAKRLAHET